MRKLAALVTFAASTAAAQCVMCQRTAAAAQSVRAHVIDYGIIVIAVPAFAILGGVLLLAYNRRG